MYSGVFNKNSLNKNSQKRACLTAGESSYVTECWKEVSQEKEKSFGKFVYVQFCSELSVAEFFGNEVLGDPQASPKMSLCFLLVFICYERPGICLTGVLSLVRTPLDMWAASGQKHRVEPLAGGTGHS